MRKPEGYDNTRVYGDFKKLEKGGYVCRIMKVEETKSRTDGKEMLVISLDIAEGENKDFFANRYRSDDRQDKKWGCTVYQLVYDKEGNTNRGFKTFISGVESSNSGFKVIWGDNFCESLKNKLVGGIFGEEEYEKKDGNIGVSVKCKSFRSVDVIRSGDFDIPEKKLLSGNKSQNSWHDPLDEDDSLPF